MKIVSYREGERVVKGGTVVALGLFDGVHIAHRALISRARALAEERGLLTAVFTFPSHSRGLKSGRQRLYSTEQRLDLFKTLCVDIAIVADFDSISGLSPEAFVRDCLVRDCGAELAVTGFNFRFGKGASADASDLARLMRLCGKDCEITNEITHGGKTVSTTLMRELLEGKKLEELSRLLSVPFYIEGVVESGLRLGKKLGAPTVNLPLPQNTAAPPRGVYRSATLIDGQLYPSVTNVGVCPTVGEREEHTETHILGEAGELYGKRVKVFFLGYLRDEKEFSSQEELVTQINIDKTAAMPREGDAIWAENGPSLP